MLWEVDIYPAPGQPDAAARRVALDAADLGIDAALPVAAAHGYLVQGDFSAEHVERLVRELLADEVVERTAFAPVGDVALIQPPVGGEELGPRPRLVYVLPKTGVMDPVAQSALAAMADFGRPAEAVRTFKKYWLGELTDDKLRLLCGKILANDAIEQVIVGPLTFDRLEVGAPYRFERMVIPLGALDDDGLTRLSREGQLYLSLAEMRTIQAHFRSLGRDPTDAELETVAQTWSEHCSHKTLTGIVRYRGPDGTREYKNLLKETIFAATEEIRRRAGADDWCVSVFRDNAGVVRFDDDYHVVFKVETHNHPSALEPYGGANTGIGGVIRDPLGTGLGAKPIANTDVFCFAPPDTPAESLPPGVLHPKRVMRGVVSGVRDYGNRMGIPTVNGAILFDERYLGNPLVYCGNVGLLPRDKVEKAPQAGDYIVALGGRTGRDGIHGATFSSAELTSQSESLSGGAVQIGNAITEKMLLDVVLAARDRGLYHAITDCGAGGFSSAVGEMGEELGAEVWLDAVPLKYEGLSYTEIWISEAQERMVLAVPPRNWAEFSHLAESEGVEATVIGTFVATGRLMLKYGDEQVADLSMEFLHGGRPKVIREAVYEPPEKKPLRLNVAADTDFTPDLLAILSSLNVCSKEWVIRQYDHEVQGGSVIKPLVGIANDGPSDAAVLRPVLSSRRGLVIACGINPGYGDFDTYHMAASAIDEAIRNCVAVGADPARIAILDNFCWANTDRPEELGSLVRAANACYDYAVALGTPFISGKDSLNNEFRYQDATGERRRIAIPPSLLISALGQVDDVERCVTMDFKEPGNRLYLVGETKDELGGSAFARVRGLDGGQVPTVDAERARKTFAALHRAISAGLVRACHDLSEGGLAVAAAEMAFAGGLGARISLNCVSQSTDLRNEGHNPPWKGNTIMRGFDDVPNDPSINAFLLFGESNTRFLCEVREEEAVAFEESLSDAPCAWVGLVATSRLEFYGALPIQDASLDGTPWVIAKVISVELADLKEAWQKPLRW